VIRSVSWRSVCVGHVVAKCLRPPFLTHTWHNLMGRMMASFNASLAALSPATSSHRDVRLIDEDRTREACAQLFHLRILITIVTILPETARARRYVVVLHNRSMEKLLLLSLRHHVDRTQFFLRCRGILRKL
jgi:hypothetical protein